MNKLLEDQTWLKANGFYTGELDGLLGPKTRAAYGLARRDGRAYAFGDVVSPEFLLHVKDISKLLGIPDNGSMLMACIAWESDLSFSPSKSNYAGSGAVGLIQFMPDTAKSLGTTTAALAKMSAVQQLDWVYRYFLPYKGKLKNIEDLYMAILWPRAVGKPLDYVLWSKANRPTTYRQNSGLDIDKDGVITKLEAAMHPRDRLELGFTTDYVSFA